MVYGSWWILSGSVKFRDGRMIYVVMRYYRETQFVNAVAAFDNHVDASKYVDQLDKGDEQYAYRVDSIHLNPATEK